MKYTKFIIIFLFLFLGRSSFVFASDYSYLKVEIPKEVDAKNILLYNVTDGKIIYEQNKNEKISMASLTKIMTALVAIENTSNLDEQVKIPKNAFLELDGYAKAGFKENDIVTIRDLLYATLLPSGAEAAQALAILTSGSISSFVDVMNEKAKSLSMNKTHYENPVGKDHQENYSTLSDIAKLLFYALENETFYEIYTTREYTTTNGLELESTLILPSTTYNIDIKNIKGSKSGFTKDAGLCLSSIAEFNGIKYLLITAGSNFEDGFPNHILDSITIYNYIFNHFSYQPILKKDQILATLEVQGSQEKFYEIRANEDIFLYLEKNKELEYVYEGITLLNKKIKQNDKLGEVKVKSDGVLLYTYDVVLNDTIKYNYPKEIIIGICLFIILLICFRKKKRLKKRN